MPLVLAVCFVSCLMPGYGLWPFWPFADRMYFTWAVLVGFGMLVFCVHYAMHTDRYPALGLWAIALFLGGALGVGLALLRYPDGSCLFPLAQAMVQFLAMAGCYFVALPMALTDLTRKGPRWGARVAAAAAAGAAPVVLIANYLVAEYKGFSFK